MLSDNEILRRLRAVRFSSQFERCARRATSLRGIAIESGLTREYLHLLSAGKRRLGERARVALSDTLSKGVN